ncbi:MAG TPA: nodulation protein NfeD [Gallionellaceae bacterium]|nr:nodulation protein NfeD [Gallionellaceae bacterium]
MDRHPILRALLSGLVLIACLGSATASASKVVVLNVDGAISPGTADYIIRGLKSASDEQAQLVVLKMDTPGGLDTAMRQIIKQIIASPVAVAAFVAPEGARAASAGTYILYASHIAAMAPATNLGAATPIEIGIGGIAGQPEAGDQPRKAGKEGAQRKDEGVSPIGGEMPTPNSAMAHKQINDASAYIRSLAQMRGRNIEWAEQAVRQAVSLTADEALKLKVIDVVAHDVPDLLRQVDGRKVNVLGVERTLETAGASLVILEPEWRSRVLAVIADPSIAYLLMLAGVFGLFFEFSNPGFVLPGVVGAISLLLALFAFQMLPVNYAGLGLIVLGLAFMTAEAFIPSFGVLGIGGVIAFVIGSVMLIDTDALGYGIPWTIIVPVALISALFIFLVAGLALKARRRPVVSGPEELIGSIGEVLEDFDGKNGWARVHGENWRIRCRQPLVHGQKIRVVRMDGLIFEVEPEAGRHQ